VKTHEAMLPGMSEQFGTPTQASGVKGEVSVQKPSRWQASVARRSAEARAIVPDIDLGVEVDMEAALELERTVGCGITALLLRACALALRAVPAANSAYRDGHFERYERVNVGLLVATAEIYTIPTVFDADRKPLGELGPEIAALRQRADAGTLSSPDLSGATFTLADMGPLGVATSTPVIVPPQAAAVAAGGVRVVPIVRDGAIVPGRVVTITLSCDHRILYGAAAGAFLGTIKSRLEEGSL
jgi:pyruvate dehydrogenase E2 component (dihydrolipoamide acetyltransferase)